MYSYEGPALNESKLWSRSKELLLARLGRERFEELWNDVMVPVATFEKSGKYSTCCNYVDQHHIEHVLWDRRAYTRGVPKREWEALKLDGQPWSRNDKTQRDISPPSCQYSRCKEDPTFLDRE